MRQGTGSRIIETRKTAPGLRLLDKWAVLAGGGANHRIGLFDMVMIKNNHVDAAGGVAPAIRACMVRPGPRCMGLIHVFRTHAALCRKSCMLRQQRRQATHFAPPGPRFAHGTEAAPALSEGEACVAPRQMLRGAGLARVIGCRAVEERAWPAHADETGTLMLVCPLRLLLQTLKHVRQVLQSDSCWKLLGGHGRPQCPGHLHNLNTVALHLLARTCCILRHSACGNADGVKPRAPRGRRTCGSTAWPCRSRWRRATWARCARYWPCWPRTARCASTASCLTTWRAWTPGSPVRAGRAAQTRYMCV